MTDLAGTAALIALRKAGGGGGEPSLTTKYIDENGTFYARDDGYDGYSQVEVDAYPSTTEGSFYDNGIYEPDPGFVGFYEIYVEVTTVLPMKIGTTVDDISKIICRNDRIIDRDYDDLAIYIDSLNIKMVSIIAESPNDYSRLSTGYLQEGGYLSYPDWDTLQWTMDSNGLITGSIYWGPFGYNSQGRYLGDRVWPYGMMVLDPAHLDPNTGYYHYDPGEQALATFSCQTYYDGWGDPSHRLAIKQGDRD